MEQMSEGGQDALGAPPWKDAQRYIRNSPIFYADRVETPLLIIQGDMDYVHMQQGEEFFSAMNRQGKRARFIRYWTSGHVVGGANNLDQWKQIFAWFDEFLKPTGLNPSR
jgi:dipeptidyl aminopeptidase/acylaminoacyl peptidase